MKVILDNHTLDLNFKHHLPTAVPDTEATRACLQDDAGSVLLEGYALCSAADQYCKVKGRQVALTRLLKSLPREQRKVVWMAYHEGRGRAGV